MSGTENAASTRPDADDDALASSLNSVAHGAFLSLFGILAMKALVFVTNLVLTHGLSVNLYGLYALGNRITVMLAGIVPLGSHPAIIRFLPAYEGDEARQSRVLGLACATTLLGTLAFAGGLFAAAPRIDAMTVDQPLFVEVLRIFALMLPFRAFVFLFASLFRSLELIEQQVVVLRIVRPGATLGAVALALWLGYSLVGTAIALLSASVVVFVVALALSLRGTALRPVLSGSRTELAEFANYAAPNAFSSIGALLRSRVDVLLIGIFLSSSAAGIYNVSLLLTGLIALPLASINQFFPPVASRLYARGDHESLRSVYSTATRWVFTGGLLIAAVEFVYRRELLALFGPAYAAGEAVVVLFVVSQLINCAVGSAGWLLNMTDHQYVVAANAWTLGALNIGFSYLFVLRYGLVGAALGTAGALAIVNVLRVAELWYLEGIVPFTRSFLKPIAAGAATAATLAAAAHLLSGPTLLALGSATGVCVFAGILVLAGIEADDRALIDAVVSGGDERR